MSHEQDPNQVRTPDEDHEAIGGQGFLIIEGTYTPPEGGEPKPFRMKTPYAPADKDEQQ